MGFFVVKVSERIGLLGCDVMINYKNDYNIFIYIQYI